MTPRPFYRSRLFWLGLPGLVFLLWLWLANARNDLSFRYVAITGMTEAKTWEVGCSEGVVGYLSHKFPTGVSGPAELGFNASSDVLLEPEEPTSFFPRRPFGILRGNDYANVYREVWLAWWVVVFSYSAVWLGGVGWWQRHKSHLLKLHTAP